MFVPKLFTICLLRFQLIQCLTPAGLKALAAIHTQRAKAIANAVNLRAMAHYNAALARSRTSNIGLLDHRVIRDSTGNLPLGQEQNNFGDGPERFMEAVPQNEGMVDFEIGDNLQMLRQNNQPEYSCAIQDYSNDMPQISVNFNEDHPQGGGNPDYNFLTEQGNQMSAENGVFPPNYEEPSLPRSASPHLRPHGHLITHTTSHYHGVQPIQPTTQFVTPGVNLHINQNQNAAVSPQFATATIQPGFNTAVVNPQHVVHTAGSLLHGGGFGVNVNPGHAGFVNQGNGVTQSQSIQTNQPGGSYTVPVGVGGGSVVQTQSVQQRLRNSEPAENMLQEINFGSPPEIDDPFLAEGSFGNKLGAYHIATPEFDKYSDRSGPQNLQPIVKYFEHEQKYIKKVLPSIEENSVHPLYRNSEPVRSSTEDHFQQLDNMEGSTGWSNVEFGGRDSENDRVGTIFFDNTPIDPILPLPENFAELNSGTRIQTFANLFDQTDENQQDLNRRDSNILLHPDLAINDGPGEKLGNPGTWRAQDNENSETLMKGLPLEDDPTLGSLFQVPERHFANEYLRLARSLNHTTMAELNELLVKERELINALKKNAKHDEDLLMIGYIGDSLLNDFEKRLNNSERRKREIGRQSMPLNRLITDPRARLDIPKTLDNLGAVTRTAFEHEKAPLYHVRNMVGSAQDAMMAAMKIPTNNLLIPSQYEIVNTQGGIEKLGAINPSLFGRNLNGDGPGDGIVETFNRVGSALRGSVLSGQEALNHVGEVANHAKNALHSGRYATPRMILMQIPHITREPTKKAMIITPRIFDVSEDGSGGENRLGAAEPDYVKVGHIMDAVGISNPNSKNLEFEKIVIEPADPFVPEIFEFAKPPRFLKTFKNILKRIRVENANEQDFVGNAVNTLNNVRTTVGANSLKDLLLKMKQNMGSGLKSSRNQEISASPNIVLGNKLPSLQQDTPTKPQITDEKLEEDPTDESISENLVETSSDPQNTRNSRTAENQLGPDQDSVGASLFPQGLTYPYMGHINEHQLQFPQTSEVYKSKSQLENKVKLNQDRNLGYILGAINPLMFERIFNETLKINSDSEIHSPHDMFHHHHHDGHSHGHHEVDDDKLGTSMALTGQMLTPFMGHATKKMEEQFFNEYRPQGEEEAQYIEVESSQSSEHPQWVEVLHPIPSDLDY